MLRVMGNGRKNVRYQLQALTVFRWTDRTEGGVYRAEGRTRDISTSGAFILAPACPPVGVPVKLHMVLATIPNSSHSLRLSAQGRVVRSEQPTTESSIGGFAVSLERVLMHGGETIVEIE
jgi:hypothetical protein